MTPEPETQEAQKVESLRPSPVAVDGRSNCFFVAACKLTRGTPEWQLL